MLRTKPHLPREQGRSRSPFQIFIMRHGIAVPRGSPLAGDDEPEGIRASINRGDVGRWFQIRLRKFEILDYSVPRVRATWSGRGNFDSLVATGSGGKAGCNGLFTIYSFFVNITKVAYPLAIHLARSPSNALAMAVEAPDHERCRQSSSIT